MRTLLLLGLLLAACSQPREAPSCQGEPFALNTGLWQSSPEDLRR
jgi:hypothetical protein